jgi:hypothetical protein
MKWMAAGEIGAYLLGLSSAIAACMYLDSLKGPAKIMVFVAVLWLATKWSQWFVHLGFDGKVDERA